MARAAGEHPCRDPADASIGADAVVGAGAAVVQDVPADRLSRASPAQPIGPRGLAGGVHFGRRAEALD